MATSLSQEMSLFEGTCRSFWSRQNHHTVKRFSPLARLPGFDLVRSACAQIICTMCSKVLPSSLPTHGLVCQGLKWAARECKARQHKRNHCGSLDCHEAFRKECLWKASKWKWKWWAPSYAAPCLDGILPRLYDKYLCLRASALYFLLKDYTTRDEVCQAMDRLSDFALKMEPLYGKGIMTFNVHQLLHLPKSTAELGPPWSHSACVQVWQRCLPEAN